MFSQTLIAISIVLREYRHLKLIIKTTSSQHETISMDQPERHDASISTSPAGFDIGTPIHVVPSSACPIVREEEGSEESMLKLANGGSERKSTADGLEIATSVISTVHVRCLLA
jgi:hypothetical protein